MLKRLKNLKNKDMSYRRYSDIPKVDGRNIQFIPKSNKLIFEKLGWRPNYPLKQGIEQTYNWIVEQLKK